VGAGSRGAAGKSDGKPPHFTVCELRLVFRATLLAGSGLLFWFDYEAGDLAAA
jgi:hypothetical protein